MIAELMPFRLYRLRNWRACQLFGVRYPPISQASYWSGVVDGKATIHIVAMGLN